MTVSAGESWEYELFKGVTMRSDVALCLNVNSACKSLHKILTRLTTTLVASCPPVERYTIEGIEVEMENSYLAFLENNCIKGEKSTRMSLIFKWYREDFGGSKGLKKIAGNEKIEWMEYDWGGGEEEEWKGGVWETIKGIL